MSGESVNCLLGHEQGRGLSGSQSPGGWRTTSPPWLPPSAPWYPVLVIALSAATAQLNLPISGNSSCTHPRSLSVTMLTRQLLPSMKYTIPCAIIPSPVIMDTPVILAKNTPATWPSFDLHSPSLLESAADLFFSGQVQRCGALQQH